MSKNVLQIDLSRLQRFFIASNAKTPVWSEVGHFVQGFDFKLERVREVSGSLAESCAGLGYKASGTCELAQMSIEDLNQDLSLMTGKAPIAMLIGKKPFANWLSGHPDDATVGRLYVFQKTTSQDNRIAMVADAFTYNGMQKVPATFSGWIDGFEAYDVKNLSLTNNKLKYDIVKRLFTEGVAITGSGIQA